MSLPKHLNQKAKVLFVLLFFTSNLIIGQSFFNNYSELNEVSDLDIRATNAGFSLEILFGNFENANITTDANGNLISNTDYPGLGSNSPSPPFSPLAGGNFLKQPGNGSLFFEILSPNGAQLNSFTLATPTGATFVGTRGKVGAFSNGDLLLPYHYITATGRNFGAARVNATSGQIIWQTNVALNHPNGVPRSGSVAINNNDETFIMVDNFDVTTYNMLKFNANGNLMWNNNWGGASKTPSNFVTTPDGGIWFRWNQDIDGIVKVGGNGNQVAATNTQNIFNASTRRDAIVGTPDNGVIATGILTGSGDMWVLRLDANGGVVYANILDNLPQEIEKTTSGLLLNSGEVIFGGVAASGNAFLLKLNQDGEFDESGDGCNVSITSANGGVTITGLTSDANSKLFNPSIQPVWGCDPWQGSPCSGNETVSNLTVGATYFLSVQSSECEEWIPIVIQGNVGCPDADSDGTCDVDDCEPNDPSLPATPGSSCNDFNGNTTNDIIQSDGCTCQGTPIVSGCNVNITSSNGGVTITGLTSDANSKLFNPSIQPVWGCDPWQGSPCSGNETVSNLTVGATYFLSVQSSECEEWIPIVIQGSNGTGIDLTAANFSSNSGVQGEVVDFTFDLINAGNQTATSSYDIRTYISIDTQLSVDDIREGNIVTGGTAPGTTPNVNGAFTVPDNLFPGNYFLIIKVDDGNTVTETNENNNVFSTPITIFDDGIDECNTPVLVSQGKPATQSSTLNFGGINSGASKAVDGNTDGNYYNGSVAATTEENQAWWQVDLGAFYDVFNISVYNRTEGTARLNDFYIMASDTPFSSGNLANARNNASYEKYIPGQANVPTQWFPNNNAPVRYVRVQRTGNGYLTLAELRVNGCPVANLQGSSIENFEAAEEVTTRYLNVGDLYPNPTSGEVFSQIESAFVGEIFVQVVNVLGQVNLEQKVQLEVGINTLQLELEHCKAGIYNVIFHSKTKLISKQIVISKL